MVLALTQSTCSDRNSSFSPWNCCAARRAHDQGPNIKTLDSIKALKLTGSAAQRGELPLHILGPAKATGWSIQRSVMAPAPEKCL